MDIVLGKLEKEGMEIAEVSLRKIDSSLQARLVALEMFDASGTTFEALSAASSDDGLKTVEE